VALSAASFVVMLALSLGSSNAILRSLGNGDVSRVQLALPPSSWSIPELDLMSRLLSTEGVLGGGTITSSDSTGVSATLTSSASAAPVTTSIAVATEQGLLSRDIALIDGGGFPSVTVLEKDPAQVVLGRRIAEALGVSARPGDNSVTLNGRQATVTGVITENGDSALLTTAVIVPPQLLPSLTPNLPVRVIEANVRTDLSVWIAQQAPLMLWPQDPSAVSAAAPADPQQLRGRLETETQGLIAAVTWVMVGVSIFVVGNTMQIAIGERRKEIGVSRAFGVSAGSVGSQFFLEASILGFVGAVTGTLFGALVARAVTMVAGWEMLLPASVLATPLIGLVVGGVGGLVPAWVASRVQPLELLRSE
jgi:putative ABC transport system permease protein